MRQGRNWARMGSVAVATMTATMTLGLGMTPIAAHASTGLESMAPKIVVTPNTGLVSGQTVHVKGSGFGAKQEVIGVECLAGATDPGQCDLGNLAFVASDAHGNLKTTFAAHRTLLTATDFVDCVSSPCEMLFALGIDFTKQATAPLAFDPSVPLPPTTAKVKPATGLDDLQTVLVSGGGFNPGASVEVVECLAAPLACGPGVETSALGDGHVSTAVTVRRVLTDLDGNRIDCATGVGTCEILVFDATDVDYHTSAPLGFDPNVPPPPPPKLKVKPSTMLPYYARVSVTATNFLPGDFAIVLECASKTSQVCSAIDFEQVDAGGTMVSQPMLTRELIDEFNPDNPPIDCAATGAHCVVIVSGSDGSLASVAVSFDPDATIPPPPSASLSPAGPYRNNQNVHIKGRNFAPLASFQVAECATTADEQDCFGVGEGSQFTTATGSLATDFPVARRLESENGFVDCTHSGVACALQVSSEGGAEVTVPLTFTSGVDGTTPAQTHAARVSRRGAASWASARASRCVGAVRYPGLACTA